MTGRQLVRWSRLHERRAHGVWASPWFAATLGGAGLAAVVAWRAGTGVTAASHIWLAGTLAAFALAFMRVPFHLYWRADAALLAQLPIPGAALLDAALQRCVRAAAATTVASILGAFPLAVHVRIFAHHVTFAIVLGIAAACFLPAVAIWAAMLVVTSRTDRGVRAVRVASALAGGAGGNVRAAHAASRVQPGSSGTVLGALPGFASTIVVVVAIVAAPWLDGATTVREAAALLGPLAGGSVLSLVVVRLTAPAVMATILRDVSALDRQRLAHLEIHPPTAIERGVARLVGEAALPYTKDARLMRRRYPMAFALGALAFIVLAIVGFARPIDPLPWLIATIASAALYGGSLAIRLHRPPIELPRLAATLPIPAGARERAKLAWVITWWSVFVVLPACFVLSRVDAAPIGIVVLGAGTAIVLAGGRRRFVA